MEENLLARATFFVTLIGQNRYTKIGSHTLHTCDWKHLGALANAFHDDVTIMAILGTVILNLEESFDLAHLAFPGSPVMMALAEVLSKPDGCTWRKPGSTITLVLTTLKSFSSLTEEMIRHLRSVLTENVKPRSEGYIEAAKMMGGLWCRLVGSGIFWYTSNPMPPGAEFMMARTMARSSQLAIAIHNIVGRENFQWKNAPTFLNL